MEAPCPHIANLLFLIILIKLTNQRTMKIKIITNSGFKYLGKKVSEDNIFISVNDERQGIIKIPIINISFLKEVLN